MGRERRVVLVNAATNLARSIVTQLITHGVTDVLLSPGSRNAPLSIALYEAEQVGLIDLHVQIDERSAGFFALGISKASGRPVAVVCTSGTAVVNLHPALLEAWHSQIPILIITADRPARLRQTGANQTTQQVGIFVDSTRYGADIDSASFDWQPAFAALVNGPVHLNIQFDDPMLPDDESDWLNGLKRVSPSPKAAKKSARLSINTPRGVIVVGHDRAGFSSIEIAAFAAQVGWPLVAEDPLSFNNAIAHASLLLTSEKIRASLRPESVIVIGRTTLSRSINALIKAASHEIVIDPRIGDVDIKRNADEIFLDLPLIVKQVDDDEKWRSEWEIYSAKVAELLSTIVEWSEPSIARELARQLSTKSTLYVSSSRPIRDIEGFAIPRVDIETFANRGLAGIDGNISTALGIASQRESTTALMGDLAFLHDHNGLLSAKGVNLRIVVVNNDGGGIFSTLGQNGVPGFEKIFGTPHGHDLVAIGRAMGIPSVSVSTLKELNAALSTPIRGTSIVVAQAPARNVNADQLRKLYAAIANF
jgi:2-succinyl-5-enolpyruvyl-6-hydroxy-3-cyclohexene-1-carboxylate synthase